MEAMLASSMAANNTTTASPMTENCRKLGDSNITRHLTTLSAILSILGSVFIFITYCLWEDVRTTSRKILLYISLADFFVAVCHISGVWYIPSLSACIAQAFVNIVAMMSSTFWTVAMAIYLYVSVARRQVQLAQRMMVWFHLICWFAPLTMACVALVFRALGRSWFLGAAGWCWIRTDAWPHRLTHMEQTQWMFWTDYFWKIVAFGIIIVLYTLLRHKLRQVLAVSHNRRNLLESRIFDAANSAEKKLMLVPLLYVLLYVWAVVRFFLFIYNRDIICQPNMKWLTVINGVGSSAQGFANFLFYCLLTKRFMDPMRKFCRFCCCCNRNLQSTGEDLTVLSSTQNNSTVELNRGEQEPFLKVRKPNYQTSALRDKTATSP